MKLTTRLASFLMLLVLFCTAQGANAQNDLAKQIVGKWVSERLDFEIDKDKATATELAQFKSVENYYLADKDKLKGKVVFEFKANGTYKMVSREDAGEPNKKSGKWQINGNKLSLMPNNEDTSITIEGDTLRFIDSTDSKGLMKSIRVFKRTK